MTTKIQRLICLSALLYIITAVVSCSKDDDDNNPPMEVKNGLQLKTVEKFGTILTDSLGRTLYYFSNDVDGKSACTGDCIAAWPPYYSSSVSSDIIINKNEIGFITRADGNRQSTYKGWPLYYFVNDRNNGDINGDGVQTVWYVAKPDYILMVVNAQLVGDNGINYTENYSEGNATTIYLTDDKGRTLYAFAPDKKNKNNYTASDFSNNALWPIFTKAIGPVPSYVNASEIGEIDVYGRKQLTYKGWPLYYFERDTERGDNKGISFPSPGIWPIVNKNTMLAKD